MDIDRDDHNRQAAGLLERAARLALAEEYDKAIKTMDMALNEIKGGVFRKYIDKIEETQ